MDSQLKLLFIIAVLVLFGIGAYLSHLKQKKRREAMAALAERLGWEFDPSKDTSHDDQYANFELFRRGHSRAAYNMLTGFITLEGGRQLPAKMGDFLYKITRHNGKSTTTTTYRFTYLIVHPDVRVPDLLIRREGMFDKFAGALGFDDIDFESAEFSRRYCVKSPDKRFAFDIVHPRMMEFLMAADPPAIDLEHGRCCISDGRGCWEPEQCERMLDIATRYFSLWPAHAIERVAW